MTRDIRNLSKPLMAQFEITNGCNHRCIHCYLLPSDEDKVPVTEVPDEVVLSSAKKLVESEIFVVVITGGEPLMQDGIFELIEMLTNQGHRVEIETNGSLALDEFASMEHRPVFTMDYKLDSSNMEQFMQKDNFSLLKPSDTVKFVAGSISDLENAVKVINRYSLLDKCHVYFSPVYGKIKPSEIVDFMINNHLNGVRLQLQMHKFIWEPNRRGV